MVETDDESVPPVMDRDEWMRRLGPLYPALVAVRMLVAAPIMKSAEPTVEDLERSAVWFPAVGSLIGGVVALCAFLILETDLVPAIVVALVLALLVAIPGAQFEAGLGRSVDHLIAGGGGSSETKLGTIGVYGLLAFLAVLALRAILLLGIDPDAWIGVIVVSQIVSRWSVVFLQRIGDPLGAPIPGDRTLLVGGATWVAFGICTGYAFAIAILLGGGIALLAMAIAAAAAFGVGLLFQRRYGGLTSDSLASAGLVCELVVLLSFAASSPAVMSPWAS